MRKYLTVILLISTMILPFAGCSQKSNVSVPKNVSEIIIAPYESEKMTFKYTNPDKLKVFVDYLNQLNPIKTNDSPEKYAGDMEYGITLKTAKGEEKFTFEGGTFFRQNDGQWMSITYEQGEKFVELLRNTTPDVQAETPLFSK